MALERLVMARDPSGREDPPRQCGPCTLCCTAMAVFHLRKPTGTPCRHECAAGCAIYADRPRECRDYECLWLVGELADADRPDRLGVVVCREHDASGKAMICVAEPEPGAAQTPRVRELIARMLTRGETVLIRNRRRVRTIHPDGRTVEAEVDPSDEMLVNVRLPDKT